MPRSAQTQFRPIAFGSPEYHEALALRARFLREPLGLTLTEADRADEESQHHFALYLDAPNEDQRMIGALIGKPLPEEGPTTVQLRQVVIHGEHRERGHGAVLMCACEERLTELGFTRFVLYARAESAQFYEKCGYRRVGSEKVLLGIAHQRMEKLP